MTTQSDRFDIAIAGAGPVGALAALQAARRGWRTVLLDAGNAPQLQMPQGAYDLRVVALAPGSRARLAEVGAWPCELEPRLQPYVGMQVWDGSGPGKIEFSATELGLPALGHIVEVPALQCALDLAIAKQSLITRVQQGVYSKHELSKSGAVVHCRDGRTFDAACLIGADGRDSRVRKRAGIALERRDYQQRGVVAVLQPEQPHAGVARQVFTEQGPLGLLPLANGQLSIVWSVPQVQSQQLIDEPAERFCQRLASATGQPGFELVSQRVAFPLVLQNAAVYAEDTIALVGDAAHAVHPLAGLGMNLGIEDVAGLFAQLDGWQPGRSPEGALRRYARERRRNVLPAIAMMDGLDALFGSRSGEWVQLRDWGLNLVDRQARLKRAFMRYALGSVDVANGEQMRNPV